MMVIPAIDVMDGQVVRLTKGDEEARTNYYSFGSPLETAKRWQKEGAEHIHIIDLDATLSLGDNRGMIQEIVQQLEVPVQFGGGIRSLELARSLLEGDVGRIILGSLAMKSPKGVASLSEDYGRDRVVIALDHRRGVVLDKGWKGSTGKPLDATLRIFADLGLEWFLITDTDRDGTLEGPDTETYTRLSGQASIIASGGVGSLEDLDTLKETGVKAVVVGKALYEGKFTLPKALNQTEAPRC
jgi:phosphoribosylformimino-5-aminoimidazole carboxamide ribotide isomerase